MPNNRNLLTRWLACAGVWIQDNPLTAQALVLAFTLVLITLGPQL